MRLTVIIPAYNEEASIADVIRGIPSTLQGIETACVVVDDGSTDATAKIARASGAHVLSHPRRLGLAAAFRTGTAFALRTGSDFFVTLDADGQYVSRELEILFDTLTSAHADLVVGDRQVWQCTHMPLRHRIGNAFGSFMLRILGTTHVRDASSGFRVFTRALALQLRISSEHTYTHEMLIQASAAGCTIVNVPVTFLPRRHGQSKLIRSVRHHIFRSCGTILRSLFLYRPLKKFLAASLVCFVLGIGFFVAAFFYSFSLWLLISAGVFVLLGIQFIVIGLLADAHASERRIRIDDSASSL